MKKKLSPLKYSFWLLKLRDRSIGEMEEKLRRREYSAREIKETLAVLVEKNFLDDKKFAENYVRSRKLIKPVGKYYLRGKLIQKKIPTEIIDQVLSDQPDEMSEIAEAADRWLSHHRPKADQPLAEKEKIYEKLSRHLISRGFEFEKIKEILDEKL